MRNLHYHVKINMCIQVCMRIHKYIWIQHVYVHTLDDGKSETTMPPLYVLRVAV